MHIGFFVEVLDHAVKMCSDESRSRQLDLLIDLILAVAAFCKSHELEIDCNVFTRITDAKYLSDAIVCLLEGQATHLTRAAFSRNDDS
jgi:hypothetical protein